MILRQLKKWLKVHPPAGSTPTFSILTCLYEKSNADFFGQAADSVRAQTARNFQWVVLMQGAGTPELEQALRLAQRQLGDQLLLLRSPTNMGIIAGLRFCFERATQDYVFVLDGDDLLHTSAISALSDFARDQKSPDLIFSDEDHIKGTQRFAPYLRPGWDPVLNLSSSYIWHILAFRRDVGIELGVYSDKASEFCQDWDTVCRFYLAEKNIRHLPKTLYHWRQHEASSTNTTQVHQGSFDSQKNVLQRILSKRNLASTFQVSDFPLFRGAREFWLQSEPKNFAAVIWLESAATSYALSDLLENLPPQCREVIVMGPRPSGTDLGLAKSPQFCQREELGSAISGLSCEFVLFFSSLVKPNPEHLSQEMAGLYQLHSSVEVIAGVIAHSSGTVFGGDEVFSNFSPLVCPSLGSGSMDPGYMSLRLKPHQVSAPNARFFSARRDFLATALSINSKFRDETLTSLGYFLGATAFQNLKTVAYSPLLHSQTETPAETFRLSELPDLDSWCYSHRAEDAWVHFYKAVNLNL